MVRASLYPISACASGVAAGRIVIQPNNSLPWRASKYFLASLALLSTIIATVFLLRGFWMVLPFTILELSVVVGCFYLIAQRTYIQEVITMSGNEVILESSRRNISRKIVRQRFFTKIFIFPPKHPWHAQRIELKHREEVFELGSFLPAKEKAELAKHLSLLVRHADQALINSVES